LESTLSGLYASDFMCSIGDNIQEHEHIPENKGCRKKKNNGQLAWYLRVYV
jgi:hypothetical protein